MNARCLIILWAIHTLACDAPLNPETVRPNILIVTFDTLRADHTSLYARERRTTPNLRRLAEQGIEFTQAYSPSATTAPSHASLFTGFYPGWHGVIKNGMVLSEEHITIAERFRDEGYQTAAFVSSFVLNHRFGFDQGFETYSDRFSAESASLDLDEWAGRPLDEAFDRPANETTDDAIRWLSQLREGDPPFLLFVHYFDPHAPYRPPLRFAKPFGLDLDLDDSQDLDESIRRYDAEIAFADEQLGRLLDTLEKLGLFGDTLIVATADHGEGLTDHGVKEHGALIYEPFVRVPLVIRLPHGSRGIERVELPVSLVDVLETIRSFAMVPREEIDEDQRIGAGRDLSDWLIGRDPAPSEGPIFLHRRPYSEAQIDDVFVSGERFGVRRGRWKYLSQGDGRGSELYDVAADPDETNDLTGAEPSVAFELGRIVEDWRSGFRDREKEDVPQQVRQMLKELGYVD